MTEVVKSIKIHDYNSNIKTYDDDKIMNDLITQYFNFFNDKKKIINLKNKINNSDFKINKLNKKSSEKLINEVKTKSHIRKKKKIEYDKNEKTTILDFNKYIINIISELKIDYNKIMDWESLFEFSENSISTKDLLDIINQYTEDIIYGKNIEVDDEILEKFYFNVICFLKINSDCNDPKLFNKKNIDLLYNNNDLAFSKYSQLTLKTLQKYEKLYNHEYLLRIQENIYYGCDTSKNKEFKEKFNLRGKAFYILGKAYYNGLFKLKQDYKVAYKLFKYGALNSNAASTYNVAYCLENGIGTSINFEEAVNFYKLSYKLDYPMGLYKYARFLLRGNDFVNRDIPLGCHLLKLATKKTNKQFTAPIYDLAMIYLVPNNNVIMDRDYAIRILSYGAELGCKNCQIKIEELEINKIK